MMTMSDCVEQRMCDFECRTVPDEVDDDDAMMGDCTDGFVF